MKSLKFTIEERVRWGDVDAANIIFYGSYIRFFEIAETELFRAVGLPYGVVFDELNKRRARRKRDQLAYTTVLTLISRLWARELLAREPEEASY